MPLKNGKLKSSKIYPELEAELSYNNSTGPPETKLRRTRKNPESPDCALVVKELDRENTILIQRNPKSKIKLMVVDKYRQMIQNNAVKVNNRKSSKSTASTVPPPVSEADPSTTQELSGISFNVTQFNPKQKYSFLDSFKPKQSSFSTAVQQRKSKIAVRENSTIFKSGDRWGAKGEMGSNKSVEKSSDKVQTESDSMQLPEIGDSTKYSDECAKESTGSHSFRHGSKNYPLFRGIADPLKDSSGLNTHTPTLYRGITAAARPKQSSSSGAQKQKSSRTLPRPPSSNNNKSQDHSGTYSPDVVRSAEDESAFRMYINTPKSTKISAAERTLGDSRFRSKSTESVSSRAIPERSQKKSVKSARSLGLSKSQNLSSSRDVSNDGLRTKVDRQYASSRYSPRRSPRELSSTPMQAIAEYIPVDHEENHKVKGVSPSISADSTSGGTSILSKSKNNSASRNRTISEPVIIETSQSTGKNKKLAVERFEEKRQNHLDSSMKDSNFSSGVKHVKSGQRLVDVVRTDLMEMEVYTNREKDETDKEKVCIIDDETSKNDNKTLIQLPNDLLKPAEKTRHSSRQTTPRRTTTADSQKHSNNNYNNQNKNRNNSHHKINHNSTSMGDRQHFKSRIPSSAGRYRSPSTSGSAKSNRSSSSTKATPVNSGSHSSRPLHHGNNNQHHRNRAQNHSHNYNHHHTNQPEPHAPTNNNNQNMNGQRRASVGGYLKRGKTRVSTTTKPVANTNNSGAKANPKAAAPHKARGRSTDNEFFSDATDREDDYENVEEQPPVLPPNARIPPVITDPTLHPYDATEKCIKTLAKHPLDIDFGAWHRNVVPTLPPLIRNPQTGLRYLDRPNVFYIGKGNNTILVENHFVQNLKWTRTEDRNPTSFKFKWVQCVNQIDYDELRCSEQIVNHINNISCLTTKIGLVESLRGYERHLNRTDRKPGSMPDLKMSDFFSETYKLNNKTEMAAFRAVYKPGETWICKPNGLNQGIGIFLIRSLEELDNRLNENNRKVSSYRQRNQNYDRMIQRYIEKPLLLDNRKIDIRAYMHIASTAPFVVLYHPGYVRLCLDEYKLEDTNLINHLNNQYMQKKDPRYKKMKETTVWSYEQANDYVNKHYKDAKDLEEDWWYNVFEKQTKRIMFHCFQAAKCTLKSRVGLFDLLGFDFMIGEDMNVYLIEINVNPALATNCKVLDQVIPPIVMESIDISLEIWEKTRRGLPICPIHSRQNMEVLYNETLSNRYRRSPQSAHLASTYYSNNTSYNSSTNTKNSNANNSNTSNNTNNSISNINNNSSGKISSLGSNNRSTNQTKYDEINSTVRNKSESPHREAINYAG